MSARQVKDKPHPPEPHGHGPAGGRHGGGHEEHEGAPEWLISFADNVTLMMGFFVIMLAMSMKAAQGSGTADTEGKGQPSAYVLDTILSIRAGFNRPVDINSTAPEEQLLVQRLRERHRGDASDQGILGPYDQSQSIRPSEYHAVCGVIPFASKSSSINEEGQAVIRELGARFKGVREILDVRGNVSAAEAASLPERGMGLATERALSVARGLVAEGLFWAQLRVTACADNDRVEPRAYEAGEHASNQRVDVVTTTEVVPDYLHENGRPSPSNAAPGD